MNKSNFFKKFKAFWPTARKWLVQTLIKRYLPKLVGGVWGFLAVLVGEFILDKALKPAWNWVARKSNAMFNKIKRKPKAKRLEDANTETDFDDSFDDMP